MFKMKIERYVELRLVEALEYTKFSKEEAWSFIIRVHDKKINFTGEVIETEQNEKNKEQIKKLFTEALIKMEFSIDEFHLIELIEDLRKVKLFGLVNECISELTKLKLLNQKTQNGLIKSSRKRLSSYAMKRMKQKRK